MHAGFTSWVWVLDPTVHRVMQGTVLIEPSMEALEHERDELLDGFKILGLGVGAICAQGGAEGWRRRNCVDLAVELEQGMLCILCSPARFELWSQLCTGIKGHSPGRAH